MCAHLYVKYRLAAVLSGKILGAAVNEFLASRFSRDSETAGNGIELPYKFYYGGAYVLKDAV